jgi:hypothetical protein
MVLRQHALESDMEKFAATLGWPHRETTLADFDQGISREVVWYATPEITLHYFEDEESECGYVMVTGRDPDVVRATSELVESGLNTWRLDELADSVDRALAPEDRARAVTRAGLGAPQELDRRFNDRFS